MKTVSYKEYARELEKANLKIDEIIRAKGIFGHIWLVNIGTDEKIEMGINVSGTGDIPSIYAKRFAYCIGEAATIAQQFKYNGCAVD